jgi:hypothetical protein
MGNATAGSRATATISRNGDLVSNCVLEVQVTTQAGGALTTSGIHNLVESVEVEIGGQKIDKHYAAWLQIWNELSNAHFGPKDNDSAPVESGYGKVVGSALAHSAGAKTLYCPLAFWFNRNPGLALPLIALQYHEVKFNFQFASAAAVRGDATAPVTVNSIKMFVDYIYLDTEERRRFAQQSHEYLIDQVQYTGAVSKTSAAGSSQSLRLDFNHPCKELVWVLRETTAGDGVGHASDFKDQGANGSSALLQLNGHDRFAKRPMNYFTRVQPLQHHSNCPAGDRIGVYSFGLRPEDHQPSGTCNFSRIDNATLQLTDGTNGAGDEYQVYATNYNVLRIMSGMGGLAYSN